MKKTLIVFPIAALTIAGGAIFAGMTLLPNAEHSVEQKVEQVETQVEQKVNNALTSAGVNTTHFDDDDVEHADIQTSIGNVEVDDDFTEVPTNIITAEEAVDIAKQQASGTLTNIELENEHGIVVYSVEFEDGQTEYDFDIDAVTGDILKAETDID